jgi:hypothetical protein
MADDRILLKRSGIAGEVPLPESLELGELALNYADAAIYMKLDDGTVVDVSGIPPSNNTIYVSVSGDDSNSGREPGLAKRTIRAALNAATPFTTIDVAAGTYEEENPLILPQFTTVHGVDQRITTVRPKNPTKDLFWVCNSNYITGLAIRGHQKPSYCVAFPGVVETGVAQGSGGGNNTITLNATNSVTGEGLDDYYREMRITITSGTGSGQSGTITEYDPITRIATVSSNWSIIPDNTSNYSIDIPISAVPLPSSVRYSAHITASPYLYNLASVTSDINISGSSNNLSIGLGTKTLTIDTGLTSFNTSNFIRLYHDATNFMVGEVVSYNSGNGQLVLDATKAVGRGSKSVWEVKIVCGAGMEIDGYKAAGLRSMVSAQFTQFNSGGDGVVIKNMGYAQLVSIYGICCEDAFLAESGGTSSMGNCNVNFGNRGLVANGVGPLLMTGKSGFVYNETKCERDTKLIVDAIAQDLLFNEDPLRLNTQSTFAGLQYWNQDPLTANSTSSVLIGTGTKTFTVESGITGLDNSDRVKIVYDEDNMMYATITSYSGTTLTVNVVAVVGSGTYNNWKIYAPGELRIPNDQKVATIAAIQFGGANAALKVATTDEKNFVTARFNQIASIIEFGTARITDEIVPNKLTASSDADILAAYSALQSGKGDASTEGSIIKAVIDYITANYPSLSYDPVEFARDVGYIIDSVSFDLKFNADETYVTPSNRQTIQIGVYYYQYTDVSAVGDEIPQTVAAYDYLKTIIPTYVTTSRERDNANLKIDLIKNIIQNGPSVAGEPLPIGLVANTEADVVAASADLVTNRDAIATTLTTFVDSEFGYDNQTGFTIRVSNIVACTDPRFAITADSKPYLGLVMNIEGETTLDIEPGLGYQVGDVVKFTADVDPGTNFFIGTITSWDTATERANVTVTSSSGSGTYSSWDTNLNGETAPAGIPGRFRQELTLPISGDITIGSIDTSLVIPKYRTILQANTTGDITTLVLDQSVSSAYPNGLPKNTNVYFYQKSALSASGQTFEFVGSGTSVAVALPRNGGSIIQSAETVSSNGGIVYFTSTDQFGNFRIGEDLLINFNTGTISGRAFTRSLFAQITPFVLALDS